MKNLFLNIFWFISLFCAASVQAATEISPIVGVGTDILTFNIEDLGNNVAPLEFEPNIPGLTRLGLNAYGLGIAVSVRSDIKTLDTNKGKSDFFDLQLGYHNLKLGADLFVQTYNGFYLKNSLLYGGTPYLVYPQLKWTHYGLMGRWAIDNQGFLISALTSQSEQIKKSAGSYFLVGGYRYHSLDTDVSLIPAALQGINPEMDSLRKLKANSANLGLGAGKYWVNDYHLFIGGLLDLLGTFALYDYENLDTGNSIKKSTNSYGTLSANLKLDFGYSGEHFRFGFNYNEDLTTLRGPRQSLIKPNARQLLVYVRAAF